MSNSISVTPAFIQGFWNSTVRANLEAQKETETLAFIEPEQ